MRRWIRRGCIVAFFFCIAIFAAVGYLDYTLPGHYYALSRSAFSLQGWLPVMAQPGDNAGADVLASAGQSDEYPVDIKLFGLIPIKDATVKIIPAENIIPGGEPFGLKMFANGLMVTGFSDISTGQGSRCPGKEAGLQKGDIILSVNNQTIYTNDELISLVASSNGAPVELQVRRDATALSLTVQPVRSEDDQRYKVGIWVRDSSAGIGTVTFYDLASKGMAGLGHPICDPDTGEIVSLRKGEVVPVEIDAVKKGTVGDAGELKGHFLSLSASGTLWDNTPTGVYSSLLQPVPEKEALPIALKQEIHTGKATIYTTINGRSPAAYSVEIEKISLSGESTKNMVIRVTDPELIRQTGGIVQGMSGSPIIQDGKLVGAVTHVFVNNPQKGYAIFAETMRQNLQLLAKSTNLAS